MSEIEAFRFEDFDVRTVMIDGEPWWVLRDVCAVLGLTNPKMVANRLNPKGLGKAPIATVGGIQTLTVISEAALYELMFISDKPRAVEFRQAAFKRLKGLLTTGVVFARPRTPAEVLLTQTVEPNAQFRAAAARAKVEVRGQYVSSNVPIRCVCPKGHDCFPRPADIRLGRRWCEKCRHVFDRVYLAACPLGWGKLGIASSGARMNELERCGYKAYREWFNLPPGIAPELEGAVLSILRERGIPDGSAEPRLSRNGITETFPDSLMAEVESIINEWLDAWCSRE